MGNYLAVIMLFYNINAYNIMGQLVKSYSNQNLFQNDGLDLKLSKNQIFIIQTESLQGSQSLKIISK